MAPSWQPADQELKEICLQAAITGCLNSMGNRVMGKISHHPEFLAADVTVAKAEGIANVPSACTVTEPKSEGCGDKTKCAG